MKKKDIPMLEVKREENDSKAVSNQKGGTMKNDTLVMEENKTISLKNGNTIRNEKLKLFKVKTQGMS